MHWDETGCSNPWDSFITLDSFTLEGYHQGIHDYLTAEDITVNYISSEIDSSKIELCYACHCKTGKLLRSTFQKETNKN